MKIQIAQISDAKKIALYHTINAEHLKQWEPQRTPDYNDIDSWKQRLILLENQQRNTTAFMFLAFEENTDTIIAMCNLTSITYGFFQACYMGFSVAQNHQGKGVMKQLCSFVLDYAFNELNLNRVMANYMPNNIRSEKLLRSLGFEIEGLAKKYLKINGNWEDHVLTSRITQKVN